MQTPYLLLVGESSSRDVFEFYRFHPLSVKGRIATIAAAVPAGAAKAPRKLPRIPIFPRGDYRAYGIRTIGTTRVSDHFFPIVRLRFSPRRLSV